MQCAKLRPSGSGMCSGVPRQEQVERLQLQRHLLWPQCRPRGLALMTCGRDLQDGAKALLLTVGTDSLLSPDPPLQKKRLSVACSSKPNRLSFQSKGDSDKSSPFER